MLFILRKAYRSYRLGRDYGMSRQRAIKMFFRWIKNYFIEGWR